MASRNQRLSEIDRMLNSLEELFNLHTASADEVKPEVEEGNAILPSVDELGKALDSLCNT